MSMELVTSPGKYTCVAASIAMVTSADLDFVLAELFDSLPCPFEYPWQDVPKVPTTDEIAEWLHTRLSLSMTPFNRCPTCSPADDCGPVPVWENGEEAWLRHLSFGRGLLEGKIANTYHMCAWDGKEVFDPRGYIYPWENRKSCAFDAHRFWLII